jgi:hypothetical protein
MKEFANRLSSIVPWRRKDRGSHKSIEMGLKLLDGVEDPAEKSQSKKKILSFWKLLTLLRPYFWPAAGADGALVNRIRSSTTWLFVILSKITSLTAPFFLIQASDQLLALHYSKAIVATIIYCSLKLSSSIFKELQGVFIILL